MSHNLGRYLLAFSALLATFLIPSLVRADDMMGIPLVDPQYANEQCPVGLVSGLTLDQEFGPGTSLITNCVERRRDVKAMFQIDRYCANVTSTNAACTSPYALGNMQNVIDDYEITAGMKRGVDYRMIAIVYGGGGSMLLLGNPFQKQVEALQAEGVTFYFCQNTLRGFIKAGLIPNPQVTGIPASNYLIPGVQFVTAGVGSVLDHELRGWANIAP
ncbi:MAG: DsrE family protein [Sulfuricaulis sp.]